MRPTDRPGARLSLNAKSKGREQKRCFLGPFADVYDGVCTAVWKPLARGSRKRFLFVPYREGRGSRVEGKRLKVQMRQR